MAVFLFFSLFMLTVPPAFGNEEPVYHARTTVQTASTPAGSYTVQVGEYTEKASAETVSDRLGQKGIQCRIETAAALFILRCGSYQSPKQAYVLRKRLAAQGIRGAFPVPASSDPSVYSDYMQTASELPESEPAEPAAPDNDLSPETLAPQQESAPESHDGNSSSSKDLVSPDSEQTGSVSQSSGIPAKKSLIEKIILQQVASFSRHEGSLMKTVILGSSLALVAATVFFFGALMFLRRLSSFQAFRARRILKGYSGLFRRLDDSEVTFDYLADKIAGIGNKVIAEQVINEAVKSAGPSDRLFELYDLAGITEKYIEILSMSRSWKKRAFACEKLGHIGSGLAVPSLVSIIHDVNDEDEDVRTVALRSLGRIKDKRAIPSLIEALGSPETWLPPRVAEILVNIGADSIAPLIKELKNFQCENRRKWAAEILGWLNARGAVHNLIESLLDGSPDVRASAAGALGKLKDNRAIGKLTELLISEPIPFVRTKVSEALGAIGNPATVHHLVNILKDPEWWVRIRAVEALEQLGESSVSSLLVALEDEEREVRKRAAMALEKIGYVKKILEDYGTGIYKPELRKILFLVAQAGVIESLCEKISLPDIDLQKKIVRLLGEAKTIEAAGLLIELLQNASDWSLKARIIGSLGSIGARDAVPLLIDCLKDSEYWVRRSAVESLGILDALDHADVITGILDDPNPFAREAALRVLGMLKVTAHWEKIERLLVDPVPQVRATALNVMRQLGIVVDKDAILKTLIESSDDVRKEAIRYFSSLRDADVLHHVIQLLPYGSNDLRQEIIEYVKCIQPEKFQEILSLFSVKELSSEAVSALIEIAALIRDHDAYTFIREFTDSVDEFLREKAFRAISGFGFREHEDIFEKALFDPSREVRTVVLACVDDDTGDDFLDKASVLAQDPDEDVRLALVLAFGASGNRKYKPLIMGMLDDPSPRVVAGSLISLATFNDRSFLGAFHERKDMKVMRNELSSIVDDARFTGIIEIIKGMAQQSRNFEVAFLFANNERDFSLKIVRQLKESLDPIIRINGLEMLKLIAAPDIFTSILSVMKKDPYADVRIEAMEVITSIGREEEIISALSAMLADPAPGVRNRAAELLGNYPNVRALEALLHVLDTPDRSFREVITTALSFMLGAAPERMTELLKCVPETKTRKLGMIWLMGKSRNKGSVSFLLKLLADPDPDVRAAAVGAMGKFKQKQFVNSLEKLVYDPNERVRAAAVNSTVATGGQRAFEITARALQDVDEFVRTRAIVGLAKLDLNEAITVIQVKAAKFLEFRPYLQALNFVAGISSEEIVELNPIAVSIVEELCNKEEMLAVFKQSADKERRLHAFRVLSIISPDDKHTLINSAMNDPAPEIRSEANKHTISLG